MSTSGTLLIIDDEPAISALIRRAGEACGYSVVTATEPSTFMDQVGAAAPDVICIDLAMPGTDGIELLRLLAVEGCRAHLVIVSGFDREMVGRALRFGEALGLRVAGALFKPIRMAELKDLLSRLAPDDQPDAAASG